MTCDLLSRTDYHHTGMQLSAMTLLNLPPPLASSVLDILFDPEDGGDGSPKCWTVSKLHDHNTEDSTFLSCTSFL